MIMYEIHRFHAGAWNLDSVFDNEDLALDEAERLEGSGAEAVRVVEVYDRSNPARNRVVYRAGEVELRRGRGRDSEPSVTVMQILALIGVGVSALGLWIYLQLN